MVSLGVDYKYISDGFYRKIGIREEECISVRQITYLSSAASTFLLIAVVIGCTITGCTGLHISSSSSLSIKRHGVGSSSYGQAATDVGLLHASFFMVSFL